MLKKLIPYLLFAIYRVLYWTWKIEIIESPAVQQMMKKNQGFVIAHWHGDEFGIIHLVKKYRVACIVSTSKDGEYMNKAIRLLGAETARGSSTRQGTQALRGILRLTKRGFRPSVAVDGPKGPIYKVKPGVLQIARLAQLPILPLSFSASRAFVFKKSWNQAILPKPFSRVRVQWGEPVEIPRQADLKDSSWAQKLEQAIAKTKEKASQC